MPGEHSEKQRRQAKHVADSEEAKGMPADKAKQVGWATVAKESKAKPKPTPKKK